MTREADGDGTPPAPEGRKRKHADRDPVADWRCPDCGFVNYGKKKRKDDKNLTCHMCARPKPDEDALLEAFAAETERAEGRKRVKLVGGEAEAQLREDMEAEKASAELFLKQWNDGLADADALHEKLSDMREALADLSKYEAELQRRHEANEHDEEYAEFAGTAAEFAREIIPPPRK